MKRKLLLSLFFTFCVYASFAQKREELEASYTFNRYARYPLPEGIFTQEIRTEWYNDYSRPFALKAYAGTIETRPIQNTSDLEAYYQNREVEYQEKYLALPGIAIRKGGQLIVELYVDIQGIKRDGEAKPSGKRKNGSVTYNYTYEYYLPCSLTVRLANGEKIFEQIISHPNDLQRENYTEGNYFWSGGWLTESYAQLLEQISKRIYKKAAFAIEENFVRKDITIKFEIAGFSDKNRDYSDIATAQQIFKVAIDALPSATSEAQEKIGEVAKIYEAALSEYSADKKARINDKVKEDLHFSLALAYYLLNDFEKAKTTLKNFGKVKDAENDDKFDKKQKRGLVNFSVDGGIKSFFEGAFEKKDKTSLKIKSHQDLYDLVLDTQERHRANGLVSE